MHKSARGTRRWVEVTLLRAKGWNEDLGDSQYHDGAGVSSSELKQILQSPGHYKGAVRKETKAFSFGRAVHCAVLEPAKYDLCGKVLPELNLQRKADREQKKEFIAALGVGEFALSIKDAEQIREIQKNVRGAYGDLLLTGGSAEISGYFPSEDYDTLVKIRPDYLNESIRKVVDLKTCTDASPAGFERAVKRFKYHLSAALYLDIAQGLGADVTEFVWIAVEKEPPYAVAAYRASDMTLLLGREMYKEALAKYQKCTATDLWPAYDTTIQVLDLAV